MEVRYRDYLQYYPDKAGCLSRETRREYSQQVLNATDLKRVIIMVV